MTGPRVWISDAPTGDIVPGVDDPGAHWVDVGTIDKSQETDLWKCLQKYMEGKSPRAVEGFYLHGDSDNSWVQQAGSRSADMSGFWLAIDPFGDKNRYLVTAKRAKLGDLARRPTRSHPGLVTQAVTVGIRLSRGENGLFNYIRS